MRRHHLTACLLLALSLGSQSLQAQFSQSSQEARLGFGQTHCNFLFTADSSIRKVTPNCDCTSYRIENNKLHVTVDAREFNRDTNRYLDIKMQDGRKCRLMLYFRIAQPLLLSSRSLTWKRGASPSQQSITLYIPKGSPIKALKEAGLNGKEFDYQTKTLKKNREYQITITPLSTAKKALNRLVIKTVSSDPRYSQHIIYLQIK